MPPALEARRAVFTDVNVLVHSAITNAKRFPELRGASISSETAPPVSATIIPQLIHTALVNIILNAAESHSKCKIAIQMSTDEDSDELVIEIHDNGPGIPPQMRQAIFKPHVSTKPFNSGMGLVAVDSAMHVHNGTISVLESPILGGTCFRLTLPITTQNPGSQTITS